MAEDAPTKFSAPTNARRVLHGGWILMIGAGLVAATGNLALFSMGPPNSAIVTLTAAAPPGTPLQDLLWEERTVELEDPAQLGLLEPGQLHDLGEVVTTVRIEPGIPLRTSDFGSVNGNGAGAMSIPVSTSRAAGGTIQPGDHVSVIGGDDPSYVVDRAEVLHVHTPGTSVGDSSGYSVTIAVDTDDALAVANALRAGEIDVVITPSPEVIGDE